MLARVHMLWSHASLGDVCESLCMDHRVQVDQALAVLGLGSITFPLPILDGECERCANQGQYVYMRLRDRFSHGVLTCRRCNRAGLRQ